MLCTLTLDIMMLCAVYDIASIEYNHYTVMHRFIELCSDIFSKCGEIIYVLTIAHQLQKITNCMYI
jgi:hypothetical protein